MIGDLFPGPVMTRAGGRPTIAARPCPQRILWVLRSGVRWKELPSEFRNYVTCWRRLRDWTGSRVWLLQERDDLGGIDWQLLLAEGSFYGQKGCAAVGVSRKGKGTTILLLTDRNDLPLAAHIAGANQNEINLIEPLLNRSVLGQRYWLATRLVYDKAADSDPLRQDLDERLVELVCPHRGSRKKPPTQYGRKLRRYRHRWRMERSMSLLRRFKRLVVR